MPAARRAPAVPAMPGYGGPTTPSLGEADCRGPDVIASTREQRQELEPCYLPTGVVAVPHRELLPPRVAV
jgi:hypothetical protein